MRGSLFFAVDDVLQIEAIGGSASGCHDAGSGRDIAGIPYRIGESDIPQYSIDAIVVCPHRHHVVVVATGDYVKVKVD